MDLSYELLSVTGTISVLCIKSLVPQIFWKFSVSTKEFVRLWSTFIKKAFAWTFWKKKEVKTIPKLQYLFFGGNGEIFYTRNSLVFRSSMINSHLTKCSVRYFATNTFRSSWGCERLWQRSSIGTHRECIANKSFLPRCTCLNSVDAEPTVWNYETCKKVQS